MPQIRIGISGWTYAGWRGDFYPSDLPQRRELEYASRQLDTIEINGSFYSLQRPSTYRRWYEETPEDFVFAVKGSRYITHMKKLKEPEAPVANFFAQGILRLGEKLGPILWQFPQSFAYDAERLERFLALLPRTTAAAAELAKRHDHRLKGRAWTKPEVQQPVRHAFEVRNESFLTTEFMDLLRRHDAALVFADSARKFPYAEDATAPFVYIRLHGARELYASRYRDDELDWWAARIRAWRDGREPGDAAHVGKRAADGGGRARRRRDVYVYFDNDYKGHAPFDARRLRERLGGRA